MEKHAKCPDCGKEVTFYDDPSLQIKTEEPKKADIFLWHMHDEGRDFRLPNTQYLCPKCGKMTLVFVEVGNWD